MTEETHPESSPPVEGDRDIPSVAQRSRSQVFLIAGFLVVCVVAVVAIVYDGLEKSAERSLVDPDQEEFKVGVTPGRPFITPEPRTPPSPSASAQEQTAPEKVQPAPQTDPAELERLRAELERQRLAHEQQLREAEAAKAKLEERLRSPQIVYSASGQTAAGPGGAADGEPAVILDDGDTGRGSASRRDPNEEYLDARSSAQVVTARATQLENRDTLVPQGTLIDAVLESAIQSDLPGQIRAIVSRPVHSMDLSKVLVAAGDRLIGSYRSGIVQGQTRVFVVWERLLRANGVSIQLASVGTDALGRSGVEGSVDTHFFERFGSSLLLSLIDGAIAAGVQAAGDRDATVAIDGGRNFSRSAEIALENSINIPPTIHVDQGARIKVFVGRDLDFASVTE